MKRKESLLSIQNMSAWYGKEKKTFPKEKKTFPKEKKAFPKEKRTFPKEKRTFLLEKKTFPVEATVLSDFSLELYEHEAVGLIGLNGAGKTTFIKVLSGLLPSFRADSILFEGRPAAFRDREFKTSRCTVFAEDNSFQYFTFWEYLSYVFSAYGNSRRTAATTPDVSELLQGFHFEDYTNVLLKDLSTGNRKKVFLIAAFALKPKLLLLDEPVNGLDFQSTEYLYERMAGYKEYGTLLFSSHILESITLTSDRVLVLENGRIQQTFEGGQINAAEIREALHYENDV